MHHNIKKGANNKTFYFDGIYYRKGDWNISYADVSWNGDHGVVWDDVRFGLRNRYNLDVVIADPRPLQNWYYNDTKQFDDPIDFIKRVGNFIGY